MASDVRLPGAMLNQSAPDTGGSSAVMASRGEPATPTALDPTSGRTFVGGYEAWTRGNFGVAEINQNEFCVIAAERDLGQSQGREP
ncbi:MAG: hypothetical protein P8N76_04340 [Pirellulaceae bacterium]|nr:hypothetical protein [Pirellulaceae bacterium]